MMLVSAHQLIFQSNLSGIHVQTGSGGKANFVRFLVMQIRSRVNGILLITGHRETFVAIIHKAAYDPSFQKSCSCPGLSSNLPPTYVCGVFSPWLEQLTSLKNLRA
jgi:hypothetical protein